MSHANEEKHNIEYHATKGIRKESSRPAFQAYNNQLAFSLLDNPALPLKHLLHSRSQHANPPFRVLSHPSDDIQWVQRSARRSSGGIPFVNSFANDSVGLMQRQSVQIERVRIVYCS
jgi:hypothetical protein